MKTLLTILFVCLVSTSASARSYHHYRHHAHYASYDTGRVVSHPSGCPWHAFCGCAASIRIFGHPVRELYLASNWFRFPRAAPASGMAAVRNHHVFIIESVLGNGVVVAYDGNSGGHLTRVHQISLAGYTVVNPHGGSYVAYHQRKGGHYASRSHHHYRHYAHVAHARIEASAYHPY